MPPPTPLNLSSPTLLKPTAQRRLMYCVRQSLLKTSSKCSTRESGQEEVTVSAASDARTPCLVLAVVFFSLRWKDFLPSPL